MKTSGGEFDRARILIEDVDRAAVVQPARRAHEPQCGLPVVEPARAEVHQDRGDLRARLTVGGGRDRSGEERFDDPLELRRATVGADRVRRGLKPARAAASERSSRVSSSAISRTVAAGRYDTMSETARSTRPSSCQGVLIALNSSSVIILIKRYGPDERYGRNLKVVD